MSKKLINKDGLCNKWLNEERLGICLEKIFNKHFIHNKQIIKGLRYRPDYRNDELMLIVEFDGPNHYTDAEVILNDIQKDKKYAELGYKVVRIPFFVQMSTSIVKSLFGINIDIEQIWSHGFIDDRAVLPANFCSLGVEKFINDLNKFDRIRNDILDSLVNMAIKKGHELAVYPKSFHSLLTTV